MSEDWEHFEGKPAMSDTKAQPAESTDPDPWIRPCPRIYSVQSDGSQVAYFNRQAAEQFISERKEPEKFKLIEYVPSGGAGEYERGRRVRDALQRILEIGKRDTSNPKYDGYYEEAKEAIREFDTLAATSGTPAPSDEDLLKEIKGTFVLSSTNQIAQAVLTIIRRTAAPRQIFPTPNGLASAEIITTTGAAPPADETLPADALDGLIDQVLMGYAAGFTKPRIKEICSKWLAAQPSGAQGEWPVTSKMMSKVFAETVNNANPAHEHIYDHRLGAKILNRLLAAAREPEAGGKGGE